MTWQIDNYLTVHNGRLHIDGHDAAALAREHGTPLFVYSEQRIRHNIGRVKEAGKHITLEGQEKDVTTAGLARMNMILHDFPTANILSGNTLAAPKFKDGEQLRTYNYVVANPPFSDKTWSTGLTLGESGNGDKYQRFSWGVPPAKQGDYAYLLHIIRSMKSDGKAVCILPHGVLFRGNAEATIRKKLVRSGVDALVIEGMEAGGHIGPVSTSVLAQEILPAIRRDPGYLARENLETIGHELPVF